MDKQSHLNELKGQPLAILIDAAAFEMEGHQLLSQWGEHHRMKWHVIGVPIETVNELPLSELQKALLFMNQKKSHDQPTHLVAIGEVSKQLVQFAASCGIDVNAVVLR